MPPQESRSSRWRWPLAIFGVVVVANLPALSGLVDVNPLATFSGLGIVHGSSLLVGQYTVDPNAGITSQALGHLAALDWLRGHVPWWNPFEGLGTPLAAGMQSAAFFPPTLLLAFSGGQVPERMLLELVAGLATYALVLELGLRRWIAGVAGVLYALNGTFALVEHAAINPICLLPVCLLGVEWCRTRRLGDVHCLLLPAGVTLSIAAGFPETAYLDGILVALWAGLRVAQQPAGERLKTATRIGSLGLAGAALAAPVLFAFVDYLHVATVGGRTTFASTHLPTASLASLAVPYLAGPLRAFGAPKGAGHPVNFLFTTSWGYFSIGTVVLALFGLVRSRRELGLRLVLVAFLVVFLGRSYGLQPLETLVANVPELRTASVFRTVFPAAELALIVLAALGLEAAADPERSRRWHLAAASALVAAGAAALVLGPSHRLLEIVGRDATDASSFVIGAAAWAALVVVVLAVGGALAVSPAARSARVGRGLLGGMLVLDALALFVYPQLAAPRSVTVDTGPVRYLQAHLGAARFYSLAPIKQPDVPEIGGPLGPNYGSYFSIASVNYLDIPVPKATAAYVHAELDPGPGTEFFTGTTFGRHLGYPSPVSELTDHLAAFEASGVRYIVAGSGKLPAKALDGAKVVYDDGFVQILELPKATAYFSATGGCRLEVASRTEVTATCARPARLQRLELDLPGWQAAVDGHPAAISRVNGAFQAVELPAGRSTVTFAYEPPHLDRSLALALLALVFLAVPMVASWSRRRRRRRRRRRHSAGARRVAPLAPATGGPPGPPDG